MVYYNLMWIIGMIAAIALLVFALVLSRYEEALFDSEHTFKFFLGSFFALLIVTGVFMKFTMPTVQGQSDIASIKEALIHPAAAFQQ